MSKQQPLDSILLGILREERKISDLGATEIDLLIRQARPSRLLSTVARLVELENCWDRLPEGARQQFRSALTLADANLRTLKWELNRIQEALTEIESPVILLKGAAYAMLELPNAQGRLFGDIDILVSKKALESVETRLNWKGWYSPHNHPYDQRYFREWMHELPTLQHIKRQSVLDVHHTIIAPTSRIKADTDSMFADNRVLQTNPYFRTLSPADLILHSATHLFINGEFEHGTRDLYDMHSLFLHYGQKDGFFNELCERANHIGLSGQLWCAFRYCRLFLHTPLPDGLENRLTWISNGASAKALDFLFAKALLPNHEICRHRLTHMARYLLFIRSHYLRMPMTLLIPHLIRKGLRSNDQKQP